MEKLELKHLAPYLPYGLIVKSNRGRMYILDIYSNMRGSGMEKREIASVLSEEMKPILRPLSDLRELMPNKGVCYISYLWYEVISVDGESFYKDDFFDRCELGDISFLPYMVIPKLLEWHFDIFGLIEQDLAIDINTVNP